MTTPFLDPVKLPKTDEKFKYRQDTTYVDDSYHNDCLALSSAIWFVEFSILSTVAMSKEAVADPLPKYLLQCSSVQCFRVLEGSCS